MVKNWAGAPPPGIRVMSERKLFYGVPLGASLIALILSNILMCRERIAQAEQTVTGPCVIHCNTLHCRVWCFPLSGIGLQPIVKSGFCVFL